MEEFTLVQEMHENMENVFNSLSDYLCFDKKKKDTETFFGEMNTFRTDYLVGCVELTCFSFFQFKISGAKELNWSRCF